MLSLLKWVDGSDCPPFFMFMLNQRRRREGRNKKFQWGCTTISELMINEQVRDREIRLIGENGEQLGIMSAKDAMKIAREANLDLVKIAPTAKPPVCKIIDYGKYRYEMARKEKEAKKKQKTVEVKEVRLSPNIDTNERWPMWEPPDTFWMISPRVSRTLLWWRNRRNWKAEA